MAGLLSKERIVAGPRFNRWWNVVAALAINLSIGQAYAFSVFNLPLTRVLGVSEPLPQDWKLSALGWIFTLAYVFLGLSAGVGGKWQDRVGPRKSGVIAAALFGSGLFLSALGVWRHQLALLYLGYGVLGGCGLGLGFNTPISILLRWFPDRRGLATGMAIMGFGGGAILAAPLSTALMRRLPPRPRWGWRRRSSCWALSTPRPCWAARSCSACPRTAFLVRAKRRAPPPPV